MIGIKYILLIKQTFTCMYFDILGIEMIVSYLNIYLRRISMATPATIRRLVWQIREGMTNSQSERLSVRLMGKNRFCAQ